MIAYTSGTTGRPKGAVHVHGGFLVKIAQEVAHQVDMKEDDHLHWVTDLGWIMGPWELVGGLAAGGTVLLAEGVPDYPGPDRLWSLVERHAVTILGVSPTLIRALMKYGLEPVRSHDLGRLRILASTGEPWDPDSWRWYFEHVGGGAVRSLTSREERRSVPASYRPCRSRPSSLAPWSAPRWGWLSTSSTRPANRFETASANWFAPSPGRQ